MVAKGRLLHIQNHLAMICDSLWAINSMIIIPKMGMLYNDTLTSKRLDRVFNVPVEIANWEIDVATTATDVRELLSRISDWEASLQHSIVGNNQQEHFRRGILAEMKEMLCNLNSLVVRGSTMGLQKDPMHSMNPLQEDAYSNVLKNEVVGREEDVEKLISILQQQQEVPSSLSNDNKPFAIVIAGEVGTGKTTLAHMIYHHTWIRQQFCHRIWVEVPYYYSPLDTIDIIAKEFATSISNEEHRDQKLDLDLPLQALWQHVSEQLDGSRYFLVLHCQTFSRWKKQKWNELTNILLRVGGPGSAILITRDSITESKFSNGIKDIRRYYLDPLSEDAWVELFRRHVAKPIPPTKLDKSENDELIPFAMQHLQNLIGQPLSAKIFGSLRHITQATLPGSLPAVPQRNFEYNTFLNVGGRLAAYYDLLDANNTDADDYEVLLHMLNADYLVPAEGLGSYLCDSLDSIRKQLFSEPLSLKWSLPSMLYLRMKVSQDSTTIPSCCRYLCLKINPKVRQFQPPTIPVEVSHKLMTLILREDEETTQEDVPLPEYKKRGRRKKTTTAVSKFLNKMLVRLVHLHILILETSMIQSLPSEVSKLVNLRYLHLAKNKMELLPESLCDLTNLRILSLLHCNKLQKLPERIHKLKKLQVLKLAYCTKLQQLPKSMTRLKNLVELNVENCCWLSELPEDLLRSISLKSLNIIGCASLSRIPSGIERSIGLRKLLGIFVGTDGGLEFAQLQGLKKLEEIELRNLERAEKPQIEVLMGQQRLWNLSLHWGGEEANESSESATPLQVFEALRPNLHFERLEILSYKGVEFPNWMSKQQLARFDSLEEVRLINLKRCVKLPSLGQLSHLKKLEISGMDLITHIDNTFYGDQGRFSCLEELTFSEMVALEKWYVPGMRYTNGFPELKLLTLIQCPKLKGLDVGLQFYLPAIRVWLNNEALWSTEFCNWNNFRNIKKIEIVGCQELRCLPQGIRSLRNLSEMKINGCNNLTTLIALRSLRVLHVYACSMLLFNIEAFIRLSELKIEGCRKMKIRYDAWKKKKVTRNNNRFIKK